MHLRRGLQRHKRRCVHGCVTALLRTRPRDGPCVHSQTNVCGGGGRERPTYLVNAPIRWANTACAAGSYKAATGAGSCTACAALATTASMASTSVSQCACAAGSAGPDATTCARTFAAAPGSTAAHVAASGAAWGGGPEADTRGADAFLGASWPHGYGLSSVPHRHVHQQPRDDDVQRMCCQQQHDRRRRVECGRVRVQPWLHRCGGRTLQRYGLHGAQRALVRAPALSC